MPKPSLAITPSTSPAPASSFFPPQYRIADKAPPLKRQRCSSSPHQTRASSSATPDDFNIEREASVMRMLNVWSQLEKYSRRIDEDDIVDLVTGEIVKDRGVLSAETPWKFPRFADVDDVESTGTDEDDEDDVDELDAFAGTGEVSVYGWMVPPVREMDPADAKDLEEFMEAEKRRREECGDEEEVSEDDEELDEEQGDVDIDDTGASTGIAVVLPPTSHRAEVRDSDDELDNWDIVDESNFVCAVEKTENSGIQEILDSPSISLAHSSNSNVTTPISKKIFRSKKTPDTTPHFVVQLQTPPQSRTPSSVLSPADEFSIPIASPPSSPLPPSQQSSPIKPHPEPKRIDRVANVSQVRTRSQSRGRSPHLREDSIQELSPTMFHRGRDASRRSVRSSVAKAEERVERQASASSTEVDPPSITRHTGKSKTKSSPSSSKPAKVSPASSKRPVSAGRSSSRHSPEPQSRAAFGKERKGRNMVDKPLSSDRKGKGRAIDVEQLFDDDDPWREESNDPIGLSSSPTRPKNGRSRHSHTSTPVEKSLQSCSTARVPLPRSPEPLPQSTKKRKRKSLSLDSEESTRPADSNDIQGSSSTFDSSPAKHKMRSSSVSGNSKRPPDNSEAFHSESEPQTQAGSSHHRPRYMSATLPPYYPQSSFYSHPPYPPPTGVHPVIPLQDPRAQFIISQAMQQLSALFTAPWAAQPFTPPRRSSSARSTSTSGSSLYSYPTTPHHPHGHPYVFDSGASVDSLPPFSPPGSSPPSSSPLHGAVRRASLVPRSRSRGRRVSFRIDGEVEARRDDLELRMHDESENTRSPSVTRRGKGAKQMVANLSDSDGDAGSAGSRINARRITIHKTRTGRDRRAQTPGPPIAPAAHPRRFGDADSIQTIPKARSRPRKTI